LGDKVRVSIVASGMDRSMAAAPPPLVRTTAQRPASPFIPPPAPQPAGSHDAPDRLAEALKPSAFEELARLPAEPTRGPPALPAHSWHATDEVEITDLQPGAFGGGYAPPEYGAPQRAQMPEDDFAPAPPAQIRRPPRRMPELEDFPAVGQREYQAKAQREPQAPNVYAPHAPQAQRHAPESKKRGFFDRLTGRGKRDGDSRAERHEPAATHAHKSNAPDNSYTVGGDARGPRSGWVDDESQRQDKPELPVFFNKSRR